MLPFEHSAVTDVTVMDVTSPKNKKRRVAGRDFYSLSYRFSGQISVESGDVSLISGPNTVTFIPRGVDYETEVIEQTRMIAVHFRLASDVDFRHPAVIDADGEELSGLFASLAASGAVATAFNFKCMSRLYSIFAYLEELGLPCEGVPLCVRKTCRIIESRYSDCQLSLSRVAEEVGVSDSYLRRSFRNSLGESAVSYLCRVRIESARSMLESEYFTVAEIGERCGFGDSCYFVRKFRERVGMTPGEYRKRINNGKT